MYPICKYISYSPCSTASVIISFIFFISGIIGNVKVLIIAGGILCSCACIGGFFEYLKNIRESDIQPSVQTRQQHQQPQQQTEEVQQSTDTVIIHVTEPVQPPPTLPPVPSPVLSPVQPIQSAPSTQLTQTGACAPAADNPTTCPDPDPEP